MEKATAQLNSYRISPRKVRLVVDSIRGKKVSEAKNILAFLVKRGSKPIATLLNSAVANAKNLNMKTEDLFVYKISVDGGKVLYRRRPVAHGAAHPIRKRTSHIKIELKERAK